MIAATLAAIVVSVGVRATLQARDLGASRARTDATHRSANAAAAALSDLHLTVERALDAPPAGPRVTIRDGTLRATAGSIDDLDGPARSTLLDQVSTARDLGVPQLTATGAEAGARLFVISPRYAPGAGVDTTQARRAAFVDVVLREVDITRILGAREDLTLHATLDGTPLGVRAPETGIAVTAEGSTLGRAISVVAAAPIPVGTGISWTYLAVTIVAAAVLLGLVASVTRRTAIADAERARANADRQLVIEVGHLLGSSLDLSSTIPGVAILLTDELDLAGVVVSRRGSSGEPEPVFSLGNRPEAGSAPSVTMPLGRAGREFGELVVQPRHPLSADQLRTLETVTDLVAAAIANASLLEAERAIIDELNRVDAMKTDFLATVSHEVRTPLASIIGFSTLLRGSWDRYTPEQIRDFISRIDLNAVSLSAMLSDILDFSRLERGAVEVAPSRIDLVPAIKDVVRRNGPLFEGHRVQVETPDHLEAVADRSAFEQVISNLLTNAVKFAPEGTRIRVIASERASGVRVIVEDEGPGVLPEERDRIFDRFFRGSSELARRTRGAGIGLAVVSDLVARMGGVIHVEEGATGGAAFVLELKPAEASHRRPVEARERVR